MTQQWPTDEPQPAPAPRTPPASEQPPPLTAFAWRNGLIRPVRGRVIAGVCGALARATKTDPVLWRVIMVVLALFAGVGVLLYLIGWLLLPAEGDTASPTEALAGRGRSSTSTAMTIVVGIVALMLFGAAISEPFRPGLLVAAVLGGALLLLLRDQRVREASDTAGTGLPAAGGPPDAAEALAPAGSATPPPSYQRPRSRLGVLTFSIVLIVLGSLALADLSWHNVATPIYPAAALAVTGIGLLVGAWLGRARGLIGLGLLLCVALAVTTGSENYNYGARGGSVTWKAQTVAQLQHRYEYGFGDARLDLRSLSLHTDATQDIEVSLAVGNLEILLPPDLGVTVDANVHIGSANVFGTTWSGIYQGPRSISDVGSSGHLGKLHISADVALGNLEVHR